MQATATEDSKSERARVALILRDGGDISIPLASLDEVRTFLRSWYLHDRFEGRDGPTWGADYSGVVAASTREALEAHGVACVSMFESRTRCAVWFDRSLRVLNPIIAGGGEGACARISPARP